MKIFLNITLSFLIFVSFTTSSTKPKKIEIIVAEGLEEVLCDPIIKEELDKQETKVLPYCSMSLSKFYSSQKAISFNNSLLDVNPTFFVSHNFPNGPPTV